MQITESMIKESIESNMEGFRKKALAGGVTGSDVANLFGFGEMYSEGETLEKEFESIRDEVAARLNEAENDETDASTDQEGGSDNGEENTDNPETGDEDKKNDDSADDDKEKKKDEPKDDKEKEEAEKGPLKPGETTHLQSFEEFFKETNSKIKIQKQGSEPSPMFGQSAANHDKYKVTITNDKGGDVSWIYWSSEEDTEKGIVPDTEKVMKDFGKILEKAVVGVSFEQFKDEFGYDSIDSNLAHKQYESIRKMKDNIKKIYPDQHNIYQLIQLAKK